MSMRLLRLTLIPLAAVAVLIVAGVVAEQRAGASLRHDLHADVRRLLPRSSVTAVNLRGRPYVVSRLGNRISTAYVTVAPRGGVARELLIVQNLDLDRRRVEHLRAFLTVPYASGASATPKETRDGVHTPFGRVDGRLVRYSARLVGHQLRVAASSGSSPAEVRVPAVHGWSVQAATTSGAGVVVELVADGVRVPRSSGV